MKVERRKQVNAYLDKFAKAFGIPPASKFIPSPKPLKGGVIKRAYDNLKVDNSKDPKIKAAYEQLAKEVQAQYEYLTKTPGINVEFVENDPYENSEAMMADVYDNKHLFVFKGDEPNSFSGAKDSDAISLNEIFREK